MVKTINENGLDLITLLEHLPGLTRRGNVEVMMNNNYRPEISAREYWLCGTAWLTLGPIDAPKV